MMIGPTVDRAQAEVMAGRICAAAGLAAQSECRMLELLGEFDEVNAVCWWHGAKSLAHWLSWCCSVKPGTAREHVRVARALRRMPTVTAAFREGRLSYSKVREVTRVVGVLDEQRLCEMALTATASQLGRMISSYRTAAGSRIKQERERSLSWTERPNGMIDFRVRLPKEEAALLIAALTAAKDQFGAPPPAPGSDRAASALRQAQGTDDGEPVEASEPVDGLPLAERRRRARDRGRPVTGGPVDATPSYGYPDAMLDVARVFLATAPEDRSGEDRTVVMVHVAAGHLSGRVGDDVPAGTPPSAEPPTATPETGDVPAATHAGVDVPAGTAAGADVPARTPFRALSPSKGSARTGFLRLDPTCHIQGVGGIEPGTARRLACDAEVIGAVVDIDGEVLALGRSRRLVSRAQRRALMIRDGGMCQFPGCHQTRHLEAHHIVSWADGGPTDLGNLLLTCRFHHTAVHEGRMRIVPATNPVAGHRWDFVMPDGRPHEDWHTADGLAYLLAQQTPVHSEHEALINSVDGFEHPESRRLRPRWAGEPFDLHECVQALFGMQLSEEKADDWEAA